MRRALAIALLLAAPSFAVQAAEPFTLTSSAFKDGDVLPRKYGGFDVSRTPPCGGENVSPPLAWTNPPPQTKSFALVMQDPDGGNGLGSVHWVAYGIPAAKTGFAEGEASKAVQGWTGGKNSIGNDHYFGPCGPAAHSLHHYVITLIATDVAAGTLKPGMTKDELLAALRGHALAPASIVARYKRPE
jgi:Raf kinase inhibitor-like YbhB/YbcL family protein